MVDRLREALDYIDAGNVELESTRHIWALNAVRETVRAYVDGETIWWCLEHKAHDAGLTGDPLGYCWDAFYLRGDPAVSTLTCRMVERRLVTPLEET